MKVKLKEVTHSIFDGKHGGCAEKQNSGYYFISVKDIDGLQLDYSNAMQISKDEFDKIYFRTNLEDGDTLYANTGDTIGKCVYTESNPLNNYTAFQKSIAVLKPNKDKIYPKYLYFKMKYETPNLRKIANGSGQKNLLLATLRDYEIDIHDYSSQIKIANCLKSIENKIIINNKIISELESMSKTLYDYWFNQFEFPNEEGKPYKSSGGKMVWNDELKREIPEGWEVVNIMENHLCKDIKAGINKFDGEKNYLPTANINLEQITDGENITYINRESRANMQPKKLSVWFAKMKNSIKHLSIPKNSGWFIEKYILSTGFQGLECNEESFSYIHCFINQNWFEVYKDVLSHGATQESVNNEDLKNVKFAEPKNKILNLFNDKVYLLLERKFMLIEENQELAKLRDFLLPLLMNGQATIV